MSKISYDPRAAFRCTEAQTDATLRAARSKVTGRREAYDASYWIGLAAIAAMSFGVLAAMWFGGVR